MVDTMNNLQYVLEKIGSTYSNSHKHNPNCGSSSGRADIDEAQYKRIMASGRAAHNNLYAGVKPDVPNRNTSRHTHRYKRNSCPALSQNEASSLNVAHYKTSPTVFPSSKSRPFTVRCCSCMPNSKNLFYHDGLKEQGFHNILVVEEQGPKKGWLTRSFCYYINVMQRRCWFSFPDVSLKVLTSSRLLEAINKTVLESVGIQQDQLDQHTAKVKKTKKKQDGRALAEIKQMRAELSWRLIRFTGWFLYKLLGRLLSSIVVHRGQLDMVKQACKKDYPVIFLPNHRSHLDYILITFILFTYDIRAPHVAAGNNLLIPFFGTLLRGLGGYFIRRKLDKRGQKDHVYRALLHSYMEELLKEKEFFEFFVEGGRTRSGKALYPKGGLLSVIVDVFVEKMIPDAYIVPVGISYDRLMDGNFCREQMGDPKRKETFWRACKAIWNVVMSKFGSVRVDFSQPFSLKEYMNVAQTWHPARSLSSFHGSEMSLSQDSPTTPDSVLKISPSEMSLYGIDVVTDNQRQLIGGLAEHVIYAAVRTQALMSTQCIAILLLNRYRQGVALKVLQEDFDWLKEEATSRGRDLGFTGQTTDVVEHALSLLDGLVDVRSEKVGEVVEQFVEPVTSLPNVFCLSYYANMMNSVFALESVIANALFSVVERTRWLDSNPEELISVSRLELTSKAELLCQYLKYEYIFCPPCVSLEQAISDSMDQFTYSEILQTEQEDEQGEVACQDYARRFNAQLAEDSDEESWMEQDTYLTVNQEDKYCMAKLTFMRRVLSPLLETYYVVLCNLVSLLKQDCPEDDFVKKVHNHLKERVSSGVASFNESVALDTMKNAVRSFQHNKVIYCYQVSNIKMLTLTNHYQREESLHSLIQLFESFRD